VQMDIESVETNNEPVEISDAMKVEFAQYIQYASQHLICFSDMERHAIRLLDTLRKKKASLDAYEYIMEWYLRAEGLLPDHVPLGQSMYFIPRKKLMQMLKKRYNMTSKYATTVKFTLPYSRSVVDVIVHQARDCVHSILTDPRWKDDDWLYFDDDPFAPPPDDLGYVADLNTSLSYIATHRRLITKENQILVPLPLYIDGAVTGQFDKLQVEALKMTLGILNRKARDKEIAWRTLGYVPNYAREDSRGKRLLIESGHISAYELYADVTDDEGDQFNVQDDKEKAKDYHAILGVILSSLKELIKEGMMVDIMYKGTLYKNCELVFFVPFVKCDGDEGDKLCLSYRSRGKHVQQLCRYCQCPNKETDNINANYAYKTEPLMKRLFEQNNGIRLKQLSQVNAENAFHGIRFGLHNNRGIHGACPWELLHAILLGIFKYAKDCFFDKIGTTSALAVEINSYSKLIGHALAHQSDRDKPRTKFAHGILKGKLMAKEFTGVLLIMSALVRTKVVMDKLKASRGKHFKEDGKITDWSLLIETLLQWEAYLCSDQMAVSDVVRLRRKHKYIMYLLKKIGKRRKGMGFKIMKFHAILHLAFDILMFGVPMNVDTGCNESHHKTTKVAAKLTQREIQTFEIQTCDRLDDFHVIDLAMEEIDGRPLWHYFWGWEHDDPVQLEPKNLTGGMKFVVFWDDERNETMYRILTRMKDPNGIRVNAELINFVWRVGQDLDDYLDHELVVCCEHTRNGTIFRSHPKFRGKHPWRDWAMIQWSDGDYPAQIWGFIDLTELHVGAKGIRLHNGDRVYKGVYAIVESAVVLQEDYPRQHHSEIWTSIELQVEQTSAAGDVIKRKFYVVDVETIKAPLIVTPNIGVIPKCGFLMMTPRNQWSDHFLQWVRAPHKTDEDEMAQYEAENQESEEEEEQYTEDEDEEECSDDEEECSDDEEEE
jgi:hypothetical protein